MRISDWSSDVCSSDLPQMLGLVGRTLETGGQEDADLEAVEGQRIAGTVGEEVDRARKVAREQRRARHQIVRRPAAHRLRTGLTDRPAAKCGEGVQIADRKSTRLNSSH